MTLSKSNPIRIELVYVLMAVVVAVALRLNLPTYSASAHTQYRIHGTNQPEYIGRAISSGCIRMTNEDVIDLYNRVKIGTVVVVLPASRWTFRAHAAERPDA
jgi:L,D-transpeptidase-like protein